VVTEIYKDLDKYKIFSNENYQEIVEDNDGN
jgi:hypothetical protein